MKVNIIPFLKTNIFKFSSLTYFLFFVIFVIFKESVLAAVPDDVHAHTRDICSTVVTHGRNHKISDKNEIYYFDNPEVGIPYESLPQNFNAGETYEQADIRSREQYLKEVPLIAASYHYRCGPHTNNILGHINDFTDDINSHAVGNNKGCKPGYYCTIEIQHEQDENGFGLGCDPQYYTFDYCETTTHGSQVRRWTAVPVCKIVEAGYYAPGRLALKEPTFDDLDAIDSQDGISELAFQMGYPYVDFNTISSDPILMSEVDFNTWTNHYEHCYDHCECRRDFVPVDEAVELWGFTQYEMEKNFNLLPGVFSQDFLSQNVVIPQDAVIHKCAKCDFNLFTDRSWAFDEATSNLNVGDFVYGKCKGGCCRHNKIGTNCDGSIGSDNFNHICVPEKIENICSPKYKCPEGTISVQGASYCVQNLFVNREWDAETLVTRSYFTEQDLEADEASEISSPCPGDTQSSIINIVNSLGDISYDYNSISLPRRYQNMHYQNTLEVYDSLGTYNGNPTTAYKSIIRSAVMWTAYKEENIDAGSFSLKSTPFFLPGKLSSSKLPFTNTWHCVPCPEGQWSKGSENRCCDLQSEWNTVLGRCVVACPLNFKIECQSSRRHHRADEAEGHASSSEVTPSVDSGCICTPCPYGHYVNWDKLSCISCGEISGAGRRPVTNEQMQCLDCANNERWSSVEVGGRNVLSSGSCELCAEHTYKNPLVWDQCIGCPIMINDDGDEVQSQRFGDAEYCTAPNVPGLQRIQPVPDNVGDPVVEEWCPDGFEKAHSTYCVSCALGKTRKLILGYHLKKDPACHHGACPLLEYPIYNLEGCQYCDAGSAPLISQETAYIFSPFSYTDYTDPEVNWYISNDELHLKCADAYSTSWSEVEFKRFDLQWLNNLMRVNCYEYYPSKSGPRSNKLQGPMCSGRNKIISGSECSTCPIGTYASLTDNFCIPCSTGLSCEMDQGCTSSSDCSACSSGKYIAYDFLTDNNYKFMDPNYEGLLVRPPIFDLGRNTYVDRGNNVLYFYEFRTGRECPGSGMLQSNIIPDITCDWGLDPDALSFDCEDARVGRSDNAHKIQGDGSVFGERWGDYNPINISEGNYMEMSYNAYSKFLIAHWGQWTTSEGVTPKGQAWQDFTDGEDSDFHVALAVYGVHEAHRKCSDKVEFQVIDSGNNQILAHYNDNFCDFFYDSEPSCPCPKNHIRALDAEQKCQSVMCAAGKFYSLHFQMCEDCQMGKYNDGLSRRPVFSCKSCDSGKYTSARASVAEIDCEYCSTGAVWNLEFAEDGDEFGVGCEICNRPGTCVDCPAGKYTQLDETGSSSICESCLPGSFSVTVATENSYASIGTSPCTLCTPGTYQDEAGMSVCKDCPVNTYLDFNGGDEIIDCVTCNIGQHASFTASPSCLDCDAGKKSIFKDFSVIYLEAYDKACENGYTIHEELCSWYECESCEAGKYSLSTASVSCSSCLKNTFSTVIGSQLATDCEYCPKGKSTDGNLAQISCSNCPAGKFSNTGGDCQDCPSSHISSPGSSSCTQCSAGKFVMKNVCNECQAGKFSQPGDLECTPCLEGTFSEAGASFCLGCGEGKGLPVSVTAKEDWDGTCEDCPVGKSVKNDQWFDTLGSEMYPICSDCRDGTFSDVVGTHTCEFCEQGKFSDAGTSFCTDCAIGEFTLRSGTPRWNCRNCDTWTYQLSINDIAEKFVGSVAGQKICCPSGSHFYDTTSGLCVECPRIKISVDGISCEECDVNTIRHDFWSSEGDSPSCILCPYGSVRPLGKLQCHHPDCGDGVDWYSKNGVIICDGCKPGTFHDEAYTLNNGYHNIEDQSWSWPYYPHVMIGPLKQILTIPYGDKIPGLWGGADGLGITGNKCRPAPPGYYSMQKEFGNQICPDGEYPDYPILAHEYYDGDSHGIFSLIQSGSYHHETYRSFMDLTPYFNHNDGVPDEETINKLARKISFVGASSCRKCPIGTFVSAKYIDNTFASEYNGGDTLDADEYELMIIERWTCYPCPANKICDPNVELCRSEADCHECEDGFFVEQALIEHGEAYTSTGTFENDVAFVGKMKDGKLKEDSWTVFSHELQFDTSEIGPLFTPASSTIGNENEILYQYILKYNPRRDVQCLKKSSEQVQVPGSAGMYYADLCAHYSTVIETLGLTDTCVCNDHQYRDIYGKCVNCELGHFRTDPLSETCTACPVGEYFDYEYLDATHATQMVESSDYCSYLHLEIEDYVCQDSVDFHHKICPAYGAKIYNRINIPASASCKLCPDGFYSDTPASYASKYTFDMNFCNYIDTDLASESDNLHYLCLGPIGAGDERCLAYRNYEGSCKMCPIGKISDVDRRGCTADMDANKKYLYKTYTHNNGIYDSSKPISDYETGIIPTEDAQIICEIGYELDKSNACQPCPAHEFRADETASRCMPCSDLETDPTTSCGEYATRIECDGANIGTCKCKSGGIFRDLDKSCIDCALGQQLIGENCEECEPGAESSSLRDSCSACASGKIKTLQMNQCSECGPGEDQVLSGRDFCTQCSTGYYKTNTGSELCTSCTCASNLEYVSNCDSVEGATCTQCTSSECEGHRYISGCEQDGTPICSSCLSCEAGFENVACSLTNEGTCTACTTGKYSDEEISFECTSCPLCGPQKFRYLVCGGADSGECADCPANTAKTTFSNDDACQTCEMCTAGEYNKCCGSWCEIFKLDELNPCDSNCPSSGTAAEVCIACPLGSFKKEAAHGECISCADCVDIGNYKIGCMHNFEGICEPIPSGAIHTDEILNFNSADETQQIHIRIVYPNSHEVLYVNFDLHQYSFNRATKDESSVIIGNINTGSSDCSTCDETLDENKDIPADHNCMICIFDNLLDGVYKLLHTPSVSENVDHTIEVIKNKNFPVQSRIISQSGVNEADLRFDLSYENYVPYTFCGVNEVSNIDKSACISCDSLTLGSSAPRPILNHDETAEISPVFWPMLYSEKSWDFHKCYCAAGYSPTGSNGECMECQMSEFSLEGQLQCSACIHSSHTLTAQKNSDTCLCNAGYEPASTEPHSCTPCEAGFYKDTTDNVECSICPLGYYCEGSPGTDAGTTIPKLCEIGFYCPEQSATGIDCNTYIQYSTTALTGAASHSDCICQDGYTFFSESGKSDQCVISSTDCGVDTYHNFDNLKTVNVPGNQFPSFDYDSSAEIQNKFDETNEQNAKVSFMEENNLKTDVLIIGKISFRVIFEKDRILQIFSNPTFDHYRLSKKSNPSSDDGNIDSFEFERPKDDATQIGDTAYYYFDFTEQDFNDLPVTGSDWKAEIGQLQIVLWPFTAEDQAISLATSYFSAVFSSLRYIWLPGLTYNPQLHSCGSTVSQCDSQINYLGNLFCFNSCEDSCNRLQSPRSFKINPIPKQDSHDLDSTGQDLHIRGFLIHAGITFMHEGSSFRALLYRNILKLDENNECESGSLEGNYVEVPFIDRDVWVQVTPYDAFQIGSVYRELQLPTLLKACSECPEFSTSIPASTDVTECLCNSGFTGTSDSVAGCVACQYGEFKVQKGHASCSGCPVGKTSAKASTSSSDCFLENPNETPFQWPNFTDVADASKVVHPLVLCNDYDLAIIKSTLEPKSPIGDTAASVGGCASISYDVVCEGGGIQFIYDNDARNFVLPRPSFKFYDFELTSGVVATYGETVYFYGTLMDTVSGVPASNQYFATNTFSAGEDCNDAFAIDEDATTRNECNAAASQVCKNLCTDYGADCKGYATYHGWDAIFSYQHDDDYSCYIFFTNSESEEGNSNSEFTADDLVLDDWKNSCIILDSTEVHESWGGVVSDSDYKDIFTPYQQSYTPHWNFYKKNCEALPEVEPEPPTAFYEANCVAINPCAETSQRGESVHSIPKKTWTLRSPENFLDFPSEIDVTDKMINYFGFEYARIPLGVILRTCAPDFDKVRIDGTYECNVETIKTIVGTCDLSKVSEDSVFSFDCVQQVQFDAEQDGTYIPNAYLPGRTMYTSSTLGTTQMLYYDISEDYRCDDTSISIGSKLEQDNYYPVKIIPCEPVLRENAVYNADCSFTCTSPYQLDETGPDPICANQCAGYTNIPCLEHQGVDPLFAGARCVFDNDFFKCSNCYGIQGKEPDNALNLQFDDDECIWKDCDAGWVKLGYEEGYCTECPINTREDPDATELCIPCDLNAGEYTIESGQTTCLTCFIEDVTSISCESGRKLYSQLDLINDFYTDNGLTKDENEIIPYKMREWCQIGYVCLPCPPGTFESSGECVACPDNKYQNNYGHTSCYDCPTNQETLSPGADTISDCKCTDGYEFSSV